MNFITNEMFILLINYKYEFDIIWTNLQTYTIYYRVYISIFLEKY